MTMISNQVVEAQDAAIAAFNNGVVQSVARAAYVGTMFEGVFDDQWAELQREYEDEYTAHLSSRAEWWAEQDEAAQLNEQAEFAEWSDAYDAGDNIYAL